MDTHTLVNDIIANGLGIFLISGIVASFIMANKSIDCTWKRSDGYEVGDILISKIDRNMSLRKDERYIALGFGENSDIDTLVRILDDSGVQKIYRLDNFY